MNIDIAEFDADSLRKAAYPLRGSESDEAQVVRACLELRGVGTQPVVKFARRLSDEEVVQVAHRLKVALPGCDDVTLFDFLQKNSPPIYSDSIVGQLDDLTFIDHSEECRIFCGDEWGSPLPNGWEGFHEAFPDSRSIFTFSRVGFNREVNESLMSVDDSFGRVCSYMLCRKTEGHWRIEEEERAVYW